MIGHTVNPRGRSVVSMDIVTDENDVTRLKQTRNVDLSDFRKIDLRLLYIQ